MIKFKPTQGQLFITGMTPNDRTISFSPINEERLKLYDPEKNYNEAICNGKDVTETHSKVILYANFSFSMPMLTELEKSKILIVSECSNEKQQVTIFPLFGFSESKLQEVLFDLSEKFNL